MKQIRILHYDSDSMKNMDATGELKKLQLLKEETGELSSNDEKRFVV